MDNATFLIAGYSITVVAISVYCGWLRARAHRAARAAERRR